MNTIVVTPKQQLIWLAIFAVFLLGFSFEDNERAQAQKWLKEQDEQTFINNSDEDIRIHSVTISVFVPAHGSIRITPRKL